MATQLRCNVSVTHPRAHRRHSPPLRATGRAVRSFICHPSRLLVATAAFCVAWRRAARDARCKVPPPPGSFGPPFFRSAFLYSLTFAFRALLSSSFASPPALLLTLHFSPFALRPLRFSLVVYVHHLSYTLPDTLFVRVGVESLGGVGGWNDDGCRSTLVASQDSGTAWAIAPYIT